MTKNGDDEEAITSKWKLVRSAIEHENTLKSQRVTWFLATQVFLFAGFTQIYIEAVNKPSYFGSFKIAFILSLACALGFSTSLLAWANVKAAEKAILRLQNWWLIHHSPLKEEDDDEDWIKFIKFGAGENRFPPINGIFTKNFYRILDEKQLPASIAWAWLMLFGSVISLFINKRLEWSPFGCSGFLLVFGFVFFVFLLVIYLWARHWFKQESKESLEDLQEYHPKTLALKKLGPSQEAQAPPLAQQQDPGPVQAQQPDHQQPGT